MTFWDSYEVASAESGSVSTFSRSVSLRHMVAHEFPHLFQNPLNVKGLLFSNCNIISPACERTCGNEKLLFCCLLCLRCCSESECVCVCVCVLKHRPDHQPPLWHHTGHWHHLRVTEKASSQTLTPPSQTVLFFFLPKTCGKSNKASALQAVNRGLNVWEWV